MDSVDYVTVSEAWVAHNPTQVDWFAVASVVNDTSIGFRSPAIEKSPGVFNCAVPTDIVLESVLNPGKAELPNCISTGDSDLPILLIRNAGTNAVSGIDVGFRRVGTSGSSIETINRSLNPGDTLVYYFKNNRVNLLNNVNLNYEFWAHASGDGNPSLRNKVYGFC